ncbi:MAG: collagen-like protein [Solirubrobacterales bacterium]|nr:collagen-like protein [Solirubrobacterales bacterium]
MGTGRIRDRLTFSNVVALLALFIALGGISYAAVKIPKNSVGKKQLKKNAVNSSKVKNRSLRAIDFGKGQLPAGAVGPQGSQGTEGPIGASGAPGIAGPAGEDGITGSTGPQGTPGQPGTNGSSAGALVWAGQPAGDRQPILSNLRRSDQHHRNDRPDAFSSGRRESFKSLRRFERRRGSRELSHVHSSSGPLRHPADLHNIWDFYFVYRFGPACCHPGK